MKIVIDIPQEIYEMCVKYHQVDYFGDTENIIRTAIAHGSLLQKMGRWIEHSDGIGEWWECSQCGAHGGEGMKYCMFCGAKMQEVEG